MIFTNNVYITRKLDKFVTTLYRPVILKVLMMETMFYLRNSYRMLINYCLSSSSHKVELVVCDPVQYYKKDQIEIPELNINNKYNTFRITTSLKY